MRKSATNRRLSVIDDYPNSKCARCRLGNHCSKAFRPVYTIGHEIGGYIVGCWNFEDINKPKTKRLKKEEKDTQLNIWDE